MDEMMTTFQEFADSVGITATCHYTDCNDKQFHWDVALEYQSTHQGMTYETEYHTGLAHCKRQLTYGESHMMPREKITIDIARALKPWQTFPRIGDMEGYVVPTAPKVDNILYSLQSDCQGGDIPFLDFCSEFGYDTDSRAAEATWRACVDTRLAVKAWLGSHFEAFMQLTEE